MKKYKQLIKKTTLEAGIAVGVSAACVAIMMIVSGMLDSSLQKESGVQAEVSGIRSQIAQQRDRIQSTGISTKTYESLRAVRRTMKIEKKRQEVTDLLAVLKEKFRLSSLSLQLTADSAVEDTTLKSANLNATKTNIQLTFGGMSDQHIFSFVDELTRSMPGFVRIKTIGLKRSRSLDIDAMREISRGGKPEMVASQMEVEWFGITPLEEQ